jgi:hypothetical protein
MKYLKSFIESINLDELTARSSDSRTKSISKEECLEIIKNSCKNFSLNNSELWRKSGRSFGEIGLFFQKERRGTIGKYDYKDFFDLRKEYPVPRYKSLIGSTSKEGADFFGSGSDLYFVIPFDNTQIVFAGSPDLALWSRTNQEFTDDLFTLKEYTKNFQVPEAELMSILDSSTLSSFYKAKKFGFEFFTNGPCVLIHESEMNWFINNLP